MVAVIALLCAGIIARSDCTKENATDVVKLADAADELSCMRESMQVLATLAIRAGPDEYWKVVCERPATLGPIAKVQTPRADKGR
jgi:hypothetical protein